MRLRFLLAFGVPLLATLAVVSGGAASSPPIVCGTTGTVDVFWSAAHDNSSHGSPTPNGCWSTNDFYSSTSTQWSVCGWGTGSGTWHGPAPGTQIVYNDTNASHTMSIYNDSDGDSQENDLIYWYCLPGSYLDVELEAPGSGSCGTTNYQDRNTDFTVGVYLKETYCADGDRNSIACNPTASHGCMMNAGAYVPFSYGGPCRDGTSTCKSELNAAFETACANYSSGYTLGIYGNYAIDSSDRAMVAGLINADVNNDCFGGSGG